MNDLATHLRNAATDWDGLPGHDDEEIIHYITCKKAREIADHMEAQEKLIEEMRGALSLWKISTEIGHHSFELREGIYDLLSSSQARLSEAVKVLEPFLNVRDQHPESVKLINGNMDSFTVMAVHVTKGQFLAAKAFLATLGEDK